MAQPTTSSTTSLERYLAEHGFQSRALGEASTPTSKPSRPALAAGSVVDPFSGLQASLSCLEKELDACAKKPPVVLGQQRAPGRPPLQPLQHQTPAWGQHHLAAGPAPMPPRAPAPASKPSNISTASQSCDKAANLLAELEQLKSKHHHLLGTAPNNAAIVVARSASAPRMPRPYTAQALGPGSSLQHAASAGASAGMLMRPWSAAITEAKQSEGHDLLRRPLTLSTGTQVSCHAAGPALQVNICIHVSAGFDMQILQACGAGF